MNILLFFTVIAFSSSTNDLLIQQFLDNPTIAGYFSLEKTVKKRISGMSLNKLSKLDSLGLFMSIVKVYYAHFLPKGLPGRNIFLSCNNDFFHLRKDLKRKDLEKFRKDLKLYKTCLLYQFGQDLPGNFLKVLSALEKIK